MAPLRSSSTFAIGSSNMRGGNTKLISSSALLHLLLHLGNQNSAGRHVVIVLTPVEMIEPLCMLSLSG